MFHPNFVSLWLQLPVWIDVTCFVLTEAHLELLSTLWLPHSLLFVGFVEESCLGESDLPQFGHLETIWKFIVLLEAIRQLFLR